jgi:hypothetical protein
MQSRLAPAVAAIVLLSVAGPVSAQERGSRELLHELGAAYVRPELAPDTIFRGEDGELVRGVRCAARTPTAFERWLMESAVAEARSAGELVQRTTTVEIPVVFHVVMRKNGRFGVGDEQVEEQIRILNEAFDGFGYSFTLQEIQRHRKNRFARKCDRNAVERKMKRRYAVDPATTLNIYSCRPGGGILGYAYLPSDLEEDDTRNGVVVLYSSLPGGDAAPYNQGDTVVHEVGHYLGLFHTFDPAPNGCRAPGDRVADTPAEASPAYGCPANRDTCPAEGKDPVTNFMDYSDDACMDHFTPGQASRIDEQLGTHKPSLLARGGS